MVMRTQRHGLSLVSSYQDSPAGPFGGHATLANGLVAYWKLDEASGTRIDAHGSLDLTDNNTVGSAAKGAGAPANMPATVASLVAANSEYLSRASSDAALEFAAADEATFAVWVKVSSTATYAGLIGKVNATGQMNYLFRVFSDTIEQFYWHDAGPAQDATALGTTWHLIAAWKDGGTLYVQTDNGVAASAAVVPVDKAHNTGLKIGTLNGAGQFFNGLMSSPAVWSRKLTAQERTDLWASGDGLFY